MSTLKKIIATDNDCGSLVLRFALGIVMLAHGCQKVFGIFGGYGLAGTIGFFTGKMGIPLVFAWLDIAAEFLGPLGLITGLLTRVAAFGIGCVMVVAVFMVHLPNGFFMNWFGAQQGEGFEYHILALGIAVALMIKGGGYWSVDRLLSKDK